MGCCRCTCLLSECDLEHKCYKAEPFVFRYCGEEEDNDDDSYDDDDEDDDDDDDDDDV